MSPTSAYDGLDWPILHKALADHTRTTMGANAVQALTPLPHAAAIRDAHDLVDEVNLVESDGSWLPIAGVHPIAKHAAIAAKGGVLPLEDLLRTARSLNALVELRLMLMRRDDLPKLRFLTGSIALDTYAVSDLMEAFAADGELCPRRFPELAELRTRVNGLHLSIRSTLNELVKGESLSDVLQDRFVTQRSERYVLPIKAFAKNSNIGIVHDTSGSGQTVFIEPHAVIALNNQLRLVEGELIAAERRILASLSQIVGQMAPFVPPALGVVTEIDVAVARATLGRDLNATRPRVGDEGVIDLRNARHPVLLLRNIEVVPNDLRVSHDTPVLVLTGPNTGGKTVALKTIGLCTLLVQYGCFIPADEGSRVDAFSAVKAVVGDQQTVHGDLSSFSGHMSRLGAMTAEASSPELGDHDLFLIDEIVQGTDPGQGAVLAQAILEDMVGRGPRIVVTTHYARLKLLGNTDSRFTVAALEYADGRPTYRVVRDTSGESRAFAVAEAMGVNPDIVARARSLLNEGDMGFAEALTALDTERARARAAEEDARHARERAEAIQLTLERSKAELERRIQQVNDDRVVWFHRRLDQAEKAIGQVVAALQRSPDPKRVAAAKATITALRSVATTPQTSSRSPGPIAVGDHVKLLPWGTRGCVVALSDKKVTVRSAGVTTRVDSDTIERISGPIEKPVPPLRPPLPTTGADDGLRVDANTLDLRGQRYDDAVRLVDRFFSDALMSGFDVVYLLHGHGTGALKRGLRQWLTTEQVVTNYHPADIHQGGDAVTVVHLG